jgi:hypothetical protein
VSRWLVAASSLAVFLSVLSCDMPTLEIDTPAYDPTTLTGGLLYHWDPGREITIFIDRTAEPAEADLDRAVRAAIAAWTPVGRLGEVRLAVTTDVRNADVIIHHYLAPRLITDVRNVEPEELCEPLPTGAGGYTFLCIDDLDRAVTFGLLDGSGGRVKMDISINRDAVETEEIFGALVAHEIGHVLGIGAHSSTNTDLMFGSPRRLTPSPADARTLRFVLGQRPDVRF